MNNKGYSYKPFKVDNKLQQGKVFNIMGIFMHDTGPHGKFSDSVLLVKTKNDMEGCFFVLIYCAAWKMYMDERNGSYSTLFEAFFPLSYLETCYAGVFEKSN